MSGVLLRVEGLTKRFDDGTVAVRDVDLELHSEELLCFLGPSGCGKTTLLRMIAGLEEPTEGDVYLGDERITDWPPQRRNIGLVFQHYALFKHMTVRENLTFAPRMRGAPEGDFRDRFDSLVETLDLADLLETRASRLNMSARQRVAMGRSLIANPRLLLLDEPLNNFDPGIREEIRAQLKRWQVEFERSMIYVTHDQEEALTLGDRVVVMRDGATEQVGTPSEIYERPANLFVADFIGRPSMNLIDARRVGDRIEVPDLDIRFTPREVEGSPMASDLKVGIRPEHLMPEGGERSEDQLNVRGRVDLTRPAAARTIVDVETANGATITALVRSPYDHDLGDEVSFVLDPRRIVLFDADTGRRVH